jgi:hypothetical protein
MLQRNFGFRMFDFGIKILRNLKFENVSSLKIRNLKSVRFLQRLVFQSV